MFSVKQGIIRLHKANQRFWFVYAVLAVPIIAMLLDGSTGRSNLVEIIQFNYVYIIAVLSGQTTQLDLLIGLPLAIIGIFVQLGFISLFIGTLCQIKRRTPRKTCAGF